MYKIIALIRVSSDIQETSSQKESVLRHIRSLGFKDDDILWEEIKASATKAGQDYLDFIQKIKQDCHDFNIKNICVYHLNRLGRREEILFEFKRFLIDNKIQFYSVDPGFKLLNDDGTVNPMTDLLWNMFISMVTSETAERENKIQRGKHYKHITEQKYIGGFIPYGYSVNENKDMVINPEEANIVQQIFTKYATGKYSGLKLAREFNLMGIKRRGGLWYTASVMKMISSESYCGRPLKSGFCYPRIIDDELFEKCQKIRDINCVDRQTTKEYVRQNLGAGLIRCPRCGRRFVAEATHYICVGHKLHANLNIERCTNGHIKNDLIDGILWHIARPVALYRMLHKKEDDIRQLKKEISEINNVITGLQKKTDEIKTRKKNLEERYYSGKADWSEDRFNKLISGNNEELNRVESEIEMYKGRIEMKQAEINVSGDNFPYNFSNNFFMLDQIHTEEYRTPVREIIRSAIKEVKADKIGKMNIFDIELYDGRIFTIEVKLRAKIAREGKTPVGIMYPKGQDREIFEIIYQKVRKDGKIGDGYELEFNKTEIQNLVEPRIKTEYIEELLKMKESFKEHMKQNQKSTETLF